MRVAIWQVKDVRKYGVGLVIANVVAETPTTLSLDMGKKIRKKSRFHRIHRVPKEEILFVLEPGDSCELPELDVQIPFKKLKKRCRLSRYAHHAMIYFIASDIAIVGGTVHFAGAAPCRKKTGRSYYRVHDVMVCNNPRTNGTIPVLNDE